MTEPSARLTIVEDPTTVAERAAALFAERATAAVGERGRFVVTLAGGSTPAMLYERLATAPFSQAVPWNRTRVLFGDERTVPPDHPESNYGMAYRTLLSRVPIPPEGIYRIRGELAPEAAAETYERDLDTLFGGGSPVRSDLLLLGLGNDGHTASLFPDTTALEETRRRVVANPVPALSTTRITQTFPALNAAVDVLFLVTGAGKAEMVARVFGPEAQASRYPAQRIRPAHGGPEVLLDRAAARELPGV